MSDERYVGALDQGTRGTHFVVFDSRGEPISEAFTSNERQTTADRVEYNPLKQWGGATDAIRRGLVESDVGAERLDALGISSQRQTVLLWERDTGEPVTNACSWQDRRAADLIEALTPEERELVRDRTGLEPDPYFAAPTIRCLLDRTDETVRERAAAGEILVGTVDSWLLYNLTGTHATDVTNAAQTMLFDIHELAWSDRLLDLFDVPRAALPAVYPSSHPEGFGTTDPEGILNTAVPVTGVIGDQQAALLGRAGAGAQEAKVTYGTGNFFLQSTGSEPVDADGGLLTTIWYQQDGEGPLYGLEGPMFATGAALEWLREMGLLGETIRLGATGATRDAGRSVVFVPGFGGLGAPDWVPELGAAVLGIRRHTTPEDVLEAVVEAIAFQTRAVVEAAEEATGTEHDALHVDGGAITDDEFAQRQADLLGRQLTRSSVTQMTALGAGIAAGIGNGVWESPTDVDLPRPRGRRFAPTGDADVVDARYDRWREVVRTLAELPVENRTA